MSTPPEQYLRHVPKFLEPYQRIKSGGRLIPEIEGLRFIAIFVVYLFHLVGDLVRHSPAEFIRAEVSNDLVRLNLVLTIAVPMFFVISGFVLGLPFAQSYRILGKSVSLKKYFWRRITRLAIPYLLSLILFFALKIAGGRGTAAGLWPNLLASAFYVHNLVFARPSDINFVAWSLEVEIQFYILVPLLAGIFAIRAAVLRWLILVGGVLLATEVSKFTFGHARLQLSLLNYLQYFLVGFLLVELYLHNRERRLNYLWDLAWVGTVVWLGVVMYGGDSSPWLAPWLIALLFLCGWLGPLTNRFLTNPWITTVGGMCYSIYLLHNYGIAALGVLLEPLAGSHAPIELRLLFRVVLITPIVLCVGALYFRWVERPCMRPYWMLRALPDRSQAKP